MYSSKEICYNDASCDCMFITDICNNNITSEYDSRFSDLIGYDPLTDPAVRDLTNIIHQDDLDKFRKVRNSLSSGNPFDSLNLRLIKKDRTVIYARCNFIYTTTDDNYERIIYAFSVLGDSEYYRQCSELIKVMQPLMFKFRQSEAFPFFYNDSFLKIIGYTREEADTLNLSYTDFMNSRDVDHFVHAIRSAGKSGTVCSCTVRILDKSGNTNWVSCSFKKMRSSCGEDYFIGIGEDITEHKKTENDLLRNRMLLKNITENLSCATFALNEDETKAELIRANRGFCTLFGYSDGELEKFRMKITELIIHPDDYSDFIHGIMRTGSDTRNICRAVTGSGRTIWISFASFSTFEDDRPCYVCTFHNITSLQETQNELEATRSALARTAAKCSDLFCTVNFAERTLNFPDLFAHRYNIPECIPDMPEGLFRNGFINESFLEPLTELYFNIKNGQHEGSCIFKFTPENHSPLWLRAVVTAADGRDCVSSRAIIIISDISEQMTSEETLESILGPHDENEIFSCTINLCKSKIISCRNPGGMMHSVSEHTMYDSVIISSLISRTHPEDRNLIASAITVKSLWKNYFDGNLSSSFQFRIKGPDNEYVRTNAKICYHSEDGTDDVLLTVSFSECENEPAANGNTGSGEPSSVKPHTLVSKDVFRALVNDSLSSSHETGTFQALYVLDLNGFMDIRRKHGPETGRKILDAVGESVLGLKLPSVAGKMYGDEFLVFVKDIKSYDDININAKRICSICREIDLPPEVDPESVTGCVGVSYAPLHGNDFDTLYRKAEISLHSAKKFDRTRYAIYSDDVVSDRRQLSYSEFTEKAAEAVKSDTGIYHLYTADIKHFRNINHGLGYEKGNVLLLEICSMLQEFLKSGEYFTRVFGDNFLLLTRVHSPEEVAKRMDEINYRLQSLHMSESGEVQFAAGYVTIDNSNRSSEFAQLLDCSILAHQKAKHENGTSFIKFEPGMSDEAFHKFEILSEISDAVKNGQICTFVQPQYDILNHEYVSMEALVRWNHPVRGLLSPDSFIGVCEENGFISSIDFCVLEQMCSFIRKRLDAGLRVLPVAVNQSQVTIHESGYVRRIISLVEKYSVPPEYIELEVTESACVNNLKETISVLSALREYGFRISMDDFGTGYSTLNLLKDIPVDSLKIDKGFLTKNLVEKKPTEIIRAITGMAHNISIKVVCEGVEYPQQVEFLENIGCELVQGYLFGKPMPYSDINDFMESAKISWSSDSSL